MRCPYAYATSKQPKSCERTLKNFTCPQCGKKSKPNVIHSLIVVVLAIAAGKFAQHVSFSIFPGVFLPFLTGAIAVILIGFVGMKFVGKLLPH